ncbi:MAG: SDR family oxidoreductase [Deltaproteobacteria bacterium]|nr:SDR family oxidoreductase [Deltaproteobacteria bacterium]MBM4299610.1 SDR family oxidoreductase [Deltaproteobacteria bacterium]
MARLDGQVAIVTGASRGIGKAVALAFAREGARVAITALQDREALDKVEREILALDGDCIAMMADVARRGEIDRLVQAIVAKWGRIDVLVNNAGNLRLAPLENISEARWDETLGSHLKGTFNCTQAVIPFMKQQSKGKIINIAAPSALRGSYGVADYAAAKGGIVAFTKNAASELKSHNIQVNCISPVADTRMTEELTKFRREVLGIARRDRPAVSPDAITAPFVFFACSDSDYVSGQLIEVGRT